MAKGGTVDIGVREAQATEIRRAKKAAKAAGAGKNKAQAELRFSLAKEDRYIRPEASLENVSEMFPANGGLYSRRWAFYAAKPEQVSRDKVVQYIDTAPLLCEGNVDEKWISQRWPSLLEVCKLMRFADIQHFERDIQNSERVWRTTLYVKCLA